MKIMPKFTYYAIMIEKDAMKIIKKVNEQLKNGWTLIGGICVTSTVIDNGYIFYYHQAIAK